LVAWYFSSYKSIFIKFAIRVAAEEERESAESGFVHFTTAAMVSKPCCTHPPHQNYHGYKSPCIRIISQDNFFGTIVSWLPGILPAADQFSTLLQDGWVQGKRKKMHNPVFLSPTRNAIGGQTQIIGFIGALFLFLSLVSSLVPLQSSLTIMAARDAQ